uniref:Uncharacterized protein n=1 Tax=Globodera rostochiensis TaxID=31243 RepID=A0A914HT49_GLORO
MLKIGRVTLSRWKKQFKRQQFHPNSVNGHSVEVNAAANVQEIENSNLEKVAYRGNFNSHAISPQSAIDFKEAEADLDQTEEIRLSKGEAELNLTEEEAIGGTIPDLPKPSNRGNLSHHELSEEHNCTLPMEKPPLVAQANLNVPIRIPPHFLFSNVGTSQQLPARNSFLRVWTLDHPIKKIEKEAIREDCQASLDHLPMNRVTETRWKVFLQSENSTDEGAGGILEGRRLVTARGDSLKIDKSFDNEESWVRLPGAARKINEEENLERPRKKAEEEGHKEKEKVRATAKKETEDKDEEQKRKEKICKKIDKLSKELSFATEKWGGTTSNPSGNDRACQGQEPSAKKEPLFLGTSEEKLM